MVISSNQKSTTSARPPSYAEAEKPSLPDQPLSLDVQLQVWHHSSEGTSPANNDGLAAFFRDLRAWTVVPLEADGVTGSGSHDQYVPVELIYQFFIQIGSTPHNFNIFPVGAPNEFLSRYTHANNLNPLRIRINKFCVPAPVRTNDAQSWLSDAADTADDSLGILSAIVSVYLEYHQQKQNKNGRNRRETLRCTFEQARTLEVRVPGRFPKLRELFDQVRRNGQQLAIQQPVQVEALEEGYKSAVDPFLRYYTLDNRMGKSLKRRTTLSDQDLYELYHYFQDALPELSALKEAASPLVRLLGRQKFIEMQEFLIAALTFSILLFNPPGWSFYAAVLGLGYVVACQIVRHACGAHSIVRANQRRACLGSSFKFHGSPVSNIEIRGNETEDAIVDQLAVNDLHQRAKVAQVAVAMVFCAQVMRKKIDEALPEHDRRATLESLGVFVDMDGLPSDIYRERFVPFRLKLFREANSQMKTKLRELAVDANRGYWEVMTGHAANALQFVKGCLGPLGRR
ncbi:hypothetical protein CMUS01_10855 [Colletotrichum musicola]|uniref:Uncharacterized protein n=1 Tax=Colletotrichum musicola TaxID=2175873 RepID=A0A8H6K1I3_9PEZI|nr:hypothetical protein CMUS01_10855 [Colletotrichum musicola]